MRGVVRCFDERRGLGEVEGTDGRRYPFHSTQIVGGTRRIPEGAAVDFEVGPGRRGRWEATRLAPAAPSRPGPGTPSGVERPGT